MVSFFIYFSFLHNYLWLRSIEVEHFFKILFIFNFKTASLGSQIAQKEFVTLTLLDFKDF